MVEPGDGVDTAIGWFGQKLTTSHDRAAVCEGFPVRRAGGDGGIKRAGDAARVWDLEYDQGHCLV